MAATSPVHLNANNRPYDGFVWDTGARDTSDQYAYPVGTYTVSAKSTLNMMKDNYRIGGADYTGKTVSQTYMITIVSDVLHIGEYQPAVIRGNPFSITVYGRPSSDYYLWVKDTGGLTGGLNRQAPMISLHQNKVSLDDPADPAFPIGSYQYREWRGTDHQDERWHRSRV